MLKKLRNRIEEKRNSKNILWRILVSLKDFFWQCKNKCEFIFSVSVRHIHGPKRIKYEKNEIMVLCLVRNGELWMKSFIEHYFSLGVKHIVFLDNGSTDETISIARKYKNVTILQTKVSFKKFKLLIQEYMVRRFSKNRWCLLVDVDELFDYPYSDVVSLSSLIEYLNKKGSTAVMAQMLDMFSDKPLSSLKSRKGDSIKDLYKYYDISDIRKDDYYVAGNAVSNNDIKLYKGGIRKTIFGTNVWLGKHSLFFSDGKTFLVSPHMVINAHVADFSCILYHYKFISNFPVKVEEAVRLEHYSKNSYDYKKYHDVLERNPDLVFKQKTSHLLRNVNELVDNEFLVVSQDYMGWVEKCKK